MHSHVLLEVLRHNEIRNLTANLLSEVCHNVTIEPTLQPVTRETFKLASAITDIGARSDIAADGFWGGHLEKTFFDVRVLNPLAPSNTTPTPSACYRRHEKEKQRAYEQRIREIEHASFTPIVLSTTGGMGPIATTFYKRLADRLASKWNSSYSQTIGWLRCRLSFSLLCSSILSSEELVHQRGVYPAVSLSL